MFPDPGLLAAVGVGLGLGGALVLLIAALRGRPAPHDAAVRAAHRWWRRPSRSRERDGSWLSAGMGGRLAAAAGLGTVVLALTRWPVAAAAIAALVAAWPYLFGGAGAEQAAIVRLDAMVVWTESLRDLVAVNASLEQAISASIRRAPLVIQPALDRLGGRIRVQTPLDEALLALAADLDDAGADLVIAALVLNVRRRGDRLAQVLSNLAGAAREELDLRRRVSAGRAGLRRSVQIVVVVTVAIAGYLTLFGGTYLRPYRDPAGQGALLGVVALFAAGFVWMRRLAVPERGHPLLAGRAGVPDPHQAQLITSLIGPGADSPSGPGPVPPTGPGPTTRRRP